LRTLSEDDGPLAKVLYACNRAELTFRNGFARSLLETANGKNGAMAMIALFRELADRLDGRPKQATETRPQRVTIMYRRGDPPPWLPKEALPRGGHPAVTDEVIAATEQAREPDLVPMEGPPEGPFSKYGEGAWRRAAGTAPARAPGAVRGWGDWPGAGACRWWGAR
jgi:hypothetical protein